MDFESVHLTRTKQACKNAMLEKTRFRVDETHVCGHRDISKIKTHKKQKSQNPGGVYPKVGVLRRRDDTFQKKRASRADDTTLYFPSTHFAYTIRASKSITFKKVASGVDETHFEERCCVEMMLQLSH